ncbi:proteophosphoglycan ppg4 [Caenimonas soli]|uniref:proteophosphoglycan ppg4 n=1 Tax=Caenimonas soli TaxID=2735555 RepID=UPI001555EF1E|nr:proteophosphoglycan ppg4 [Caenimonas soli]NPC56289.1 proteophosphoglycan ppg4 [Caenimonas soli]
MSASTQFKGVFAGLAALAIAGSAIAQGNPPNAAVKDPAVGAGQQSSQTTPMGSTGTPAGGSTAAGASTTSGSTAAGASSTTGSSGSTMSGSTGGSSTTGTSMGASGAASTDTAASGSRTARADRN